MAKRFDLLEAVLSLSDDDITSIADELEQVHERTSTDSLADQSTKRRLQALLFEGISSEIGHHQDRLRRVRAFSKIVQDKRRVRVRRALAQKLELERSATKSSQVVLNFVLNNKSGLRERVALPPITLQGTTTILDGEIATEYHVRGEAISVESAADPCELILRPSSWTAVEVRFSAPAQSGFYVGHLSLDSNPQTDLWLKLTVEP